MEVDRVLQRGCLDCSLQPTPECHLHMCLTYGLQTYVKHAQLVLARNGDHLIVTNILISVLLR